MSFLLNEEFIPSREDGDELSRLIAKLQRGEPGERQSALERLIQLKAETALASLLSHHDDLTVQLATAGLWECWLNERGAAARKRMDEGIARMNDGEMGEAAKIFTALMKQHPNWAEAINKQATLLYFCGQPAASLELCRKVVAIKPHHFGAWNGMALCAVQL